MIKFCWLHQATIFQERWSLSAWKLLPTRQLAEAFHPMSPSYSGKLLMIALVIRAQSSINTRRDPHTCAIHILFLVIHTRIPCRRTYIQRWELSSTSFCSYICSYEGNLDQVLQRLVEFLRVPLSCRRNVRRPVTLCYWTISLSPLSFVFTDLYHSYIVPGYDRAITSTYLRFSEESVLDTIKQYCDIAYKNILFVNRKRCPLLFTVAPLSRQIIIISSIQCSDINSPGDRIVNEMFSKNTETWRSIVARSLQFQFLLQHVCTKRRELGTYIVECLATVKNCFVNVTPVVTRNLYEKRPRKI